MYMGWSGDWYETMVDVTAGQLARHDSMVAFSPETHTAAILGI